MIRTMLSLLTALILITGTAYAAPLKAGVDGSVDKLFSCAKGDICIALYSSPISAMLRIQSRGTDRVITRRVIVDKDGQFSLDLPPGRYVLTAQNSPFPSIDVRSSVSRLTVLQGGGFQVRRGKRTSLAVLVR